MVEFFPTARAIVTLGSITIYWYGLLYVVAFAVAYAVLRRLLHYRGLTLSSGQLLELVTWGALGAVVGGRVGYVLLYAPLYYWAHPGELWQLAQGGMSSHGGFMGVAVAVWLFSRIVYPSLRRRGAPLGAERGGYQQDKLSITPPPHLQMRHLPLLRGGKNLYLALCDVIAVPAALGLALGRMGNLINNELYITPVARAMAVGSPLLLAAVCYWYLRQTKIPGTTIGLFLVVYSLSRFGEELVREPEWPSVFGWVTWGQLYTVPLLLIGISLLLPRLFAVWSRDEGSRFDNSRA